MRLPLLIVVLVLTACAAAEPTPCQRQCGAVYDSCMDVGGVVDDPAALRIVEHQCGAAQRACERSCGE